MQVAMELPGYWPHHNHHINNMFPEMIETVKLGDQMGFDAFTMGEHHFMDYNATPDPLALAAFIGAITKRPRLMLAVMILPLHDIQRFVGQITMVDHLVGGRLELGIGRGGGAYELERFGVPSDYETSRKIFEERLEVMKILFEQENVSVDLPYTKFKDVTIVPPTIQKPYPPIWLAAMRPESAYHIAKQGFHVHSGQLRNPMSFVEEMVKSFRAGAAESPKQQGEPRISMLQWVYVTKNEADRKEKIEMAYAKQQKFMALLKNESKVVGGRVGPIDIGGSPESYGETLMIGSKEFVQERFLEFKELGVDDFVCKFHIGPDHSEIIGSMERFAEYVMPLASDGHSIGAADRQMNGG